MKKQKTFTRFIAGILSFLVCFVMFSIPVYADDSGVQQSGSIVFTQNSEQELAYTQDSGWYRQEVRRGNARIEKATASVVLEALKRVAPGIGSEVFSLIVSYILDHDLKDAYYIYYLNSQVVDSCTQRYYYTYAWYADANYTVYIGSTDTGIQTVNLCRR